MTASDKNSASFTAEDYTQAMNSIGQNLLSALHQSVNQLPSELQNRKVVGQSLSAFLANVLYKQFPEHQEARDQYLKDIMSLVHHQLNQINQAG